MSYDRVCIIRYHVLLQSISFYTSCRITKYVLLHIMSYYRVCPITEYRYILLQSMSYYRVPVYLITEYVLLQSTGISYYRVGYVLSHINPFPSNPLFLRICSKNPLKTRWKKEELLVMSNFSFFPSVF